MLIFNLKQIMDEKDITISKLAKETGISRPSITAMYNNESKSINIEFLDKIMKYLDVNLYELVKDVNQTIRIQFSKKTKLTISLSAYLNDDILFDGCLDFVPDTFIKKFQQSLYKKAGQENQNVKKPNEDVLYLLANSEDLFSVDSERIKNYEEQNKRFANLISKIGKKNSYKLIQRLLVEMLELESMDPSKAEITIVRIIDGSLFVFLMEGKTINVVSKFDQDDSKNLPKVIIENRDMNK
ncbi:helix-turn-helix domain-containing protein [Enterococcus faecalis]|uniref:helix-turn-helix domain-containing protein n=1 Tax=Enterococcus faecalis TaxID=1351 RepID=UPI001ED10165|nr:helix-turn-helix transcriptional regulator [Enterococcus faecalis]EHQ8839741.1 helix-turn-helix transcriptional regulator [Enterococcus faecalis]MDN3073255.1 helix-turn-helix transcriptional regulator [Enterococcus faecalis]